MQRLMDGGHQMYHPFQSLVFPAQRLRLVRKHRQMAGKLRRSARSLLAVLRRFRISTHRDVVEMPGASSLAPGSVLDFIGPVGDFIEAAPAGWLSVGQTVVLQQCEDLPSRFERKVSLCNGTHHPVTFFAPAKRASGRYPEGQQHAEDPRGFIQQYSAPFSFSDTAPHFARE